MLELLIDFILGSCWVWVKLVVLLKTEKEARKDQLRELFKAQRVLRHVRLEVFMNFILGSCR